MKFIAHLFHSFVQFLNFLAPLGDFLARLWIGWIFFKSGLVKIQAWQATLELFANAYHVPLLSPTVAAYLGTAAELILPILLVIGLGGRIMVLVFFIYNLVAMISYPFLWTPDGAQGLYQHISWGLLLLMLLLHGPGKLSLDHFILNRYHRHLQRKKGSLL